MLPGRKRICSPQCGFDQAARLQKSSDQADELAKRRRRRGLIVMFTAPKSSGSGCTRKVSARDDAEAAAAAALQAPEQIGVAAGVGDAHRAVGGDDLGFQQAAGGQAPGLGEAAEAAALHQPGDADRHAAAALDVAAALRRDRVVDLRPERAGADRDRAHRRGARPRSPAHEGVVQRHRRSSRASRPAANRRRSTCPGSCARRP